MTLRRMLRSPARNTLVWRDVCRTVTLPALGTPHSLVEAAVGSCSCRLHHAWLVVDSLPVEMRGAVGCEVQTQRAEAQCSASKGCTCCGTRLALIEFLNACHQVRVLVMPLLSYTECWRVLLRFLHGHRNTCRLERHRRPAVAVHVIMR